MQYLSRSRNICVAHKQGLVDQLPVKALKISSKKRWFYYFLVEKNGKVLVRQR